MRKKIIAVALSLLLSVSLMTSCSDKASDSSVSSNSEELSLSFDGESEKDISETDGKESSDEEKSESKSSKIEESSGVSESSKSEEVSKSAEASKNVEVSKTAEASKTSEVSKTAEVSKPEEASKTVEVSKSAEISKPSEVSKTAEVSKPVEESKAEESSKQEEISKPDPEPVKDTDIGGMSLYNELFSLDSQVRIEVSISRDELNKIQKDYEKYKKIGSKSPIYRKANVTLTVNNKKYTIEEVGIRLKGNMWLSPVYDKNGNLNISHYKLSFNETFDEKEYYGSEAKVWSDSDVRKERKNRRLATLKELDLKWNSVYDETYTREIYAAQMARENGILAQRISLSQLVFNGKNYGVYKIYEVVDDVFLQKNLPESALGGDLYKVGWTNKPATYEKNSVSYGVEDKDKGKKYNYNLKTNKKTSDHSALKNLLSVASGSMTKEKLESIVDTDYFAKFLAVSYFLGDPDDIRNNYNNHYVYFRKDNGKAIFIIYDNDRTLGLTYGYNPDHTGMTAQSPFSTQAAGAGGQQRNPLIRAAILNGGYLLNEYKAALKKFSESNMWSTEYFNSLYQKAKSRYESSAKPDLNFANVKKSFKFSLDGRFTSGDNDNMSFSDYYNRIMKTYKAS